MAWISPTGHSDTYGFWTNESFAYDGNTGTFAYTSPPTPAAYWSYPLELTIDSMDCGAIRYWVASGSGLKLIRVKIYYGGAWHQIHYGSYSEGDWNEISLGIGYSVTKMRLEIFNNESVAEMCFVYEAQFWAPVISTVIAQAVSDIEEITATGNGNITNSGGTNCTKRGVCWNIIGNPTVADNKSEEIGNFGMGIFSRPITGLIRGQKYYVKAYAYNLAGYGYSSQVDFYTHPSVTTYAPTNIIRADPTTITGNSLIEFDGTENMTTRGFKYGLTETDTWDKSESNSYGEGTFSLQITGLTEDTTYYIRAYATGAWGTKYGSYLEFKTAYPYGANKVEIKSEATASAADIATVGGKRSLTIENHLIQNQTIADLISAAYLADYKDQKIKLVVTKPCPAPYEIGDTIERSGALLPYYAAASALISYAPAISAIYFYGLAGRDMLIRKLNVSFSAGNYISVIELED